MLYAADFRRIARDTLRGRWPLAVLTGLVAGILGAGITGISNSANIEIEIKDETVQIGNFTFDDGYLSVLLPVVLSIFAVALVYAVIVIIIGGAVTLGYAKFNLKLVDNKDPKFEDTFSEFDRLGAGFCVQFLRGLYIFLWSLLFLIPGIVATYKYAMAPYILQENPGMTASEAITASKEMMEGNKWRLFCLQFSFIGWNLLCAFTLGLGNIVLNPYKEAAYAAFYREISGTVPVVNMEENSEYNEEDTQYTY